MAHHDAEAPDPAGFSFQRDMGINAFSDLKIDERRSMTARMAVVRGGVMLGLRFRRAADDDAATRLLTNLILNAVQHVPRRTTTPPWRIEARREGDDAVWTIADDGPGILAGYLASDGARGVDATDPDLLLDQLVNDRRTAYSGDPNAGLGTILAIEAATKLGAALTLDTDGRTMTLDGGRMRTVGPHGDDASGTVWTVRIPMVDAKADFDRPRPPAARKAEPPFIQRGPMASIDDVTSALAALGGRTNALDLGNAVIALGFGASDAQAGMERAAVAGAIVYDDDGTIRLAGVAPRDTAAQLLARAAEALRPFAKAGELFIDKPRIEGGECVYAPAAGRDYAIDGEQLRKAHAAYAAITAAIGG